MTVTAELEPMLAPQQGAVQLLLTLEQAGAVTLSSLELSDPTMAFDHYESLGRFLGTMKRWTSWALGDWLNFGEGVYGELFAQAVAATGLNEQTLLHYQFVCKNVPAGRRQPTVAFGAHALVARMEPREQSFWLKKAARKEWGERELRDAIKAKRLDTPPPSPLFQDGEGGTDATVLKEVAEAVLRDAVAYVDGQHHLVPNEDIARLRAALGQEP